MFEKNSNTDSKNSTLNTLTGRYVFGGVTEVSQTTIEWWEKNKLPYDTTDVFYVMEKKFEGRPDLIAYTFYGESLLWWFICQYNSILDPDAELVAGVVLRIPTPDRLQNFKNKAVTGGIPSARIL